MKIKEITEDKQNLEEMACSRGQAEDRIRQYAPQIMKHLIKVFVFESPTDSPHWLKEINNWLRGISNLKLKGGTLSGEDIITLIITTKGAKLDSTTIKAVKDDYKVNGKYTKQLRDTDDEEIIHRVNTFLYRVAPDLSKHTFTAAKDYF